MKTRTVPVHHLELRVREVRQLFNSMDPTPFLNKDLDREAEVFIESWASGFPARSRFHITVHVQVLPAEEDSGALVADAIHNYFIYKAGLMRGELKQLLRRGRTSLFIGLAFLGTCMIGADAIGKLGTSAIFALGRESLMVAGWVAMWRPMEIFLYNWWPLVRWIHVYKSLARAHVRVVPGK